MNYYDDVNDTTIYLDDLPTVGASRPGPYSCQCNPTTGASCRECDGTAAEEREMRRLPRAERAALERRNRELLAALNAPAPVSREQKGEAA